uniref:hypothetical protein n=1 Tax=Algoriphagus sp. TaxID=1872435 RepID=UPI002588A1AD|nr:hypothetical protein [Algoriphagus sp.]
MKILAFIGWGTFLTPFAILIAKLIGWLTWTWLVTVLVAISIPIAVFLGFLVLSVWIIRNEFRDEWNQQ